MQALNLNLDEIGSAHPRVQGRMFHDHGGKRFQFSSNMAIISSCSYAYEVEKI